MAEATATDAPTAAPRTVARDATRRVAALSLMAASGAAALGYEIVWTRQGALWLGHESAAVLAILAAFFGGLGIGALALGSAIQRSRRPGTWYAACEFVIGAWGLLLTLAMPATERVLLDLIGASGSAPWQWSIAFVGMFALLLPATAAMGATLPAMERLLGQVAARGSSIGALYGANTLGAVAGVLLAAFWLVPTIGLWRTSLACAALNLGCAALALFLFRDGATDPATMPVVDGRGPAAGGPVAVATLTITGFLGIGYEVLGVRVLSQVAENTVYTFTVLLAIYLAGTALGAAAWQRWLAAAAAGPGSAMLRDRLLLTTAGAGLAGLFGMAHAVAIKAAVLQIPGGDRFVVALLAEGLIAVAAFLLPAMAMGALFSHLTAQARSAGIDLGRAFGVNTLGAAVAPAAVGVALVPVAGLGTAALLVVAGYVGLATRGAWRSAPFAVTAAALLATIVLLPPLAIVDLPGGGRVVELIQGPGATVSVVEDAAGVARLHIDNRQQEGSSATQLADSRQALLPLLLHPAPRHALFLGLGTGITATAAARDRELQVDAIELLPEVIAASARFRGASDTAEPGGRLVLHQADARRWVRTAARRYQLIVSDNFHPARSGSSALYTVEHFAAIRERLADDGVFCQWLPLHQLDLDSLRSIVGSFLVAFPQATAMLATHSLETPVLGLVGRRDRRALDSRAVAARVGGIAMAGGVAGFGLVDEYAVLGSFVAGPAALARLATGAPLNTDDLPIVAYRAPRITYVPDTLPRDRLFALLGELSITPRELLAPSDVSRDSRLAAYWRARDRFLVAGRDVRPVADADAMLQQVREPLLEVLRTSADFRPAYDPLLRMAEQLSQQDPAEARRLLERLEQLVPARVEAGRMLSGAGG